MRKDLEEVVIVAYGRSAIAKAKKGALKNSHPVDFAGQVLMGVIKKVPELNVEDIEDVIIGCARPQEIQGSNIARLITLRAGLSFSIPAQTVTRLCSSGLQAISSGANEIMTGQADVVVAGGVEFLTAIKTGTPEEFQCRILKETISQAYISMGETAENVAEQYNVSREEMDKFAVESHRRAAKAQEEHKFDAEIIPVAVKDDDGNDIIFDSDEGIRKNTNIDVISNLNPCFKENGKVTAATSSQLSDGAFMIVLMSKRKAERLRIKPIAKFMDYNVVGVDPGVMGIGPIKSIPIVMKKTGLSVSDMDTIELNEAFAAQAIPCIKELGLDVKKVNPNGGAIALGHPLGATGGILVCKALSELERIDGKYALISMCVGGGMGVAGIFERL